MPEVSRAMAMTDDELAMPVPCPATSFWAFPPPVKSFP